jgi:hypothetical protein
MNWHGSKQSKEIEHKSEDGLPTISPQNSSHTQRKQQENDIWPDGPVTTFTTPDDRECLLERNGTLVRHQISCTSLTVRDASQHQIDARWP